jgi:ribonuclease Z
MGGIWSDIYKDNLVSVSAAPILHSIPCIGFVIQEASVPGKMDPNKYLPDIKRTKTPLTVMSKLQQGESIMLLDGTTLQGPARRAGRKLVILGDTYDPSPIAALAENADVLVHEATNAHLPWVDPNTREDETLATLTERTKSRGHSTPQMAGAFAKRIGAKKLILNHFSARYMGDDHINEEAKKIMNAIARLAAEEFGKDVICARDFMSIDVYFPS